MHLQHFQQEAINAVLKAIDGNKKKILLSLPVGVGKSQIIIEIINRLAISGKDNLGVTVVFSGKDEYLQFQKYIGNFSSAFFERGGEIGYFYHNLRDKDRREDIKNSDYIICSSTAIPISLNYKEDAVFIAFGQKRNANNAFFEDAECVYNYTLEQSIAEGVIRPAFQPALYGAAFEGFCERLLSAFPGIEVKTGENSDKGYDVLAAAGDKRIVVECKIYRDKNISLNKIEQASRYLYGASYQDDIRLLMLIGVVSEEDKRFVLQRYGITVWDIANLLYYSKSDTSILNEIVSLAFYSIADIVPLPSVGWTPDTVDLINADAEVQSNNFELRLRECGYGAPHFRVYEDICADIIMYLFGDEFSKIKRQHVSSDALFRMDMICALKGTSEFWKTLNKYYNSKFVVFEFKNYESQLDQNLIYITEKYLFNAALRNVAVIISRNGFTDNAKIASDGCLKENGKLIIDVTDSDLIKMIKIKDRGEEPADYLLSLLEDRLMSIGK